MCCECGCGWKSGFRGRLQARAAKYINFFFPEYLMNRIDNPCRCIERRTPLLFIFATELTVLSVLLMIGNAGGDISKKLYPMPIEQTVLEGMALFMLVFLFLGYVNKNYRLALIWIAYRPVYLLHLTYMLINPMYWKPFWRPIELGLRFLFTFLFTIVVWDYCKRLKDRELTGFWVNSEVDITEINKNPLFREVDSSDSLDEESVTLMTTESAGSLHFKMVREEILIREAVREKREARKLREEARTPNKTRRELEIDYVERMRKEGGHIARKELRRKRRIRREELDAEAKATNAAKNRSPYDEDIRVRAIPETHDLRNEIIREDQLAQDSLKREKLVNEKVQLVVMNKQLTDDDSLAESSGVLSSASSESSYSLLESTSTETVFLLQKNDKPNKKMFFFRK